MCAFSPLLAAYASRFQKGKISVAPQKYDVFLSFTGGDSRTYFTDFLFKSLSAAGLQVFKDDAGNQQGRDPIVSVMGEQYQCGNLHNFEEAFYEHEMQCRREEVQEWVEALCSLTRISGWMSQAIANGHEGKLVKLVVAKVSSEVEMSWIKRSSLFIESAIHYFSEKQSRESKCQFILSFRGADTRYNLAAFLYTSLVAEGIQVFNDDDPPLIGKYCVHEIRNAIDHCKISIPILSSNYASSSWCLEDLTQMVECKRTNGQMILPIFYKVNTSHVRDVSHLFGKHMLQHKQLVDEITYEQWEQALKEVGSYRGWVSENIANGHEAVPVKEVVKEVSRMLNNPQTHDPPSPSTEY
ncbi:uncharacterized protein LOC108958922 [Eucalyptus grandis]|uniref:uncharacterized protein LOC108958922 n=1 Tax=Eucalyptus grandis TaxID=71139 RepID=UPI00192ECF43|nr:uncharacterized protein LOC108958922 [Eucalyptus grandis]